MERQQPAFLYLERENQVTLIIIIIIIIIILIIWFGDTVTMSHTTKCNTYSKVRAMS